MEGLISYSAMDDNELVEASKSNPEIFGELILRYQERLFRFIRRISYFCIEDIDDIVQETFIKAYRSLNIFDTDLKFSTWIYQIARNATIDAIRKKQTRPQTVCQFFAVRRW
ncbi:MAG: RNA polymerase sigma-70 factor, ECF subfamily [Candidatus Berkelbacteria bacterium Athens1014_28]|uniref:RNA polymerase sigma factor n=1 Tax=Candidatus Berkelbacteria bacterium Athens1014_28 TaxID=2017145 RepID=A0A554LQF8_9BACT|nr:MAG: RNA polymerase sigma-70 factor, ECF subfamily [Candidatus Berkelbacteria bacterium Athens1014_28]